MMTHEEISKRAREIWEREGRPEGRDKEHWLQAEAELRQGGSAENGAELTAQSRSMVQEPADMGKDISSRKRAARRPK